MSADERPDALGRVLVTGGASGLGAAVAAAVAEAGGVPLVLDLAAPSAAWPHAVVDVSDHRAVAAAVHRLVDEDAPNGGRVSGLVTAAGIDSCGTLGTVAADAWERVVAVNLLGTAAACRAALPALAAGRGRIVTVASTLGFRALPEATAYCAAKFGVVGFTRALAAELAGRIGVTLCVPGGMQTAFFDDREARFKPPPGAALLPPSEVAAAIVFALGRPPGVELRELVLCPAEEGSWPP